jgi:hypothetical protein
MSIIILEDKILKYSSKNTIMEIPPGFAKCVKCRSIVPQNYISSTSGTCTSCRTPVKTKRWDDKERKILEKEEREMTREKKYQCSSCGFRIDEKQWKRFGKCSRCMRTQGWKEL